MCGIVGILSKHEPICDTLLDGLNELQNRGYDSMGVSLLLPDHQFVIRKDICPRRMTGHASMIRTLRSQCRDVVSMNGIAHSRWATHGGVTRMNAHPHTCYRDLFCIVHNGIIENYLDLKNQLLIKNVTFQSETDTEVIVNLISFTFEILSNTYPTEDPYDLICRAISTVCTNLQGTFGLVIQYKGLPNKLFCIRYGSPLIVGVSDSFVMVVSEKSAFSSHITHYTALRNHDLVVLQNDSKDIISMYNPHAYTFKIINMTMNDTENPFSSWTEKEIREQPLAVRRCINYGSRIESDYTGSRLGGLSAIATQLLGTNHLILMGCGTSYHACLLVAPYYRKTSEVDTVQVCDASEFDLHVLPGSGTTVVVVVSQSGETIDLALSIQKIRAVRPSILILGVINVVDSLIANEVDAGVYTNCGKERGVASTKSFVTQVIVLFLIAFYFSRRREFAVLIKDVSDLPLSLENHMDGYFEKVDALLPLVSRFRNIFIVGRSYDYHVAMEASLKIKEISYVHAEAYSSSSLKHGPFALLDETMLVILISTLPEERKKIENAYQEIHSRGSPMLVISYENMFDCPWVIKVPFHSLSFLEAVCVLQILALGLCKTLGHNPDYPRNLAKVVTVE